MDMQSHEIGSLLGHAKRIELKYIEQEKEHSRGEQVYQKPLWTRFEMKLRTPKLAASSQISSSKESLLTAYKGRQT